MKLLNKITSYFVSLGMLRVWFNKMLRRAFIAIDAIKAQFARVPNFYLWACVNVVALLIVIWMLGLKPTIAALFAWIMSHTLLLCLSSLGVKRLLIFGPYLTLIVILAGTNTYSRHIFLWIEVFGFNVLNSIAEKTRGLICHINIILCVGLLLAALIKTRRRMLPMALSKIRIMIVVIAERQLNLRLRVM